MGGELRRDPGLRPNRGADDLVDRPRRRQECLARDPRLHVGAWGGVRSGSTNQLHQRLPALQIVEADVELRGGAAWDDVGRVAARLGACEFEVGGLESLIALVEAERLQRLDRKSTRLNSSHANISYAVFCLKKKKSHLIPPHYFIILTPT